MNKVILRGNLGADPELRYTGAGTPVANFRLATNEQWTDREGRKQKKTEWHRVVVWAGLAENCAKYLSKGRSVLIEGKIQTRQWEDDKGNKRSTTEIVALNVEFLGSAPKGGRDNEEGQAGGDDGHSTDPEPSSEAQELLNTDDDVPF